LVLDYMLLGRATLSWQDAYLFSKTSGLTVVPTPCLVYCEPASFPGVKRSGREVDHSSPHSSEVKNKWRYTSTPRICFHEVGRDNVTFLFMRFLVLQLATFLSCLV
jgi:hypothetical protein